MTRDEDNGTPRLAEYPGGDLVAEGLADLRDNVVSEEALLVLIASQRLEALGLSVPTPEGIAPPYEHALYRAIEVRNPSGAHAMYNALIQRIVSFVQAYSLGSRSVEPRTATTAQSGTRSKRAPTRRGRSSRI